MPVELPKMNELEEQVFGLHNEKDFGFIARLLYHFQFDNNPVYGDYCRAIGRTPQTVRNWEEIPFLPIGFFKTHQVMSPPFTPRLTFRSSGTTGATTSRHEVLDPGLYERSFLQGFSLFYGAPQDWCIIGLLPSYLERGDSSLVYMVDRLIRDSAHPESGFYLHDTARLDATLTRLEAAGQKTLLIGVTYALLDFAAQYPRQLRQTTVMETGGMKGRARELTRAELRLQLVQDLGIERLHSEYGMTELLSQAYGTDGIFRTPPWMRVLLRDETDPLETVSTPGTGAINVIDLANIHSCAFIATEDIGRMHAGGGFEVLGRMDHSDVRGCSLLVI